MKSDRDLFDKLSETADLCMAEAERSRKLEKINKDRKLILEDHLVLFANILNALRGKGGIVENNIKVALRKEIDRTKQEVIRRVA